MQSSPKLTHIAGHVPPHAWGVLQGKQEWHPQKFWPGGWPQTSPVGHVPPHVGALGNATRVVGGDARAGVAVRNLAAVTCPSHGAIFDLRTGKVIGPPAPTGINIYRVRVEATDIEVEL
jgi:hypothetical protein